MADLTPSRYWRIAASLDTLETQGPAHIEIPSNLSAQTSPPKPGDGLVLASYDPQTQTGQVRYLGILRRASGAGATEWRAVHAEIWVDTPTGRGFWKNQPGFGFAPAKVTGYGLHDLFAECFGLEPRSGEPQPGRVRRPRAHRAGLIPSERLIPIEVIGEPTSAPRGGYVYVLRSAYGYKVGRTRNMPDRMRTFGVKLPFLYTIQLCAWFDDHYAAEAGYHRIFADKRINGEWFDLAEQDIGLIRARVVA
jgi:hypothetical protein